MNNEEQSDKMEINKRFELMKLLNKVIAQSDSGEIALPDFVDNLEIILKNGKEELAKMEELEKETELNEWSKASQLIFKLTDSELREVFDIPSTVDQAEEALNRINNEEEVRDINAEMKKVLKQAIKDLK